MSYLAISCIVSVLAMILSITDYTLHYYKIGVNRYLKHALEDNDVVCLYSMIPGVNVLILVISIISLFKNISNHAKH